MNNLKPVTILLWNLGEEEVRPVCGHPSACPAGPCRGGARPWRISKPPKEEEKEDDEEEEYDDDEEEMEGKRKDEEDMTWTV